MTMSALQVVRARVGLEPFTLANAKPGESFIFAGARFNPATRSDELKIEHDFDSDDSNWIYKVSERIWVLFVHMPSDHEYIICCIAVSKNGRQLTYIPTTSVMDTERKLYGTVRYAKNIDRFIEYFDQLKRIDGFRLFSSSNAMYEYVAEDQESPVRSIVVSLLHDNAYARGVENHVFPQKIIRGFMRRSDNVECVLRAINDFLRKHKEVKNHG